MRGEVEAARPVWAEIDLGAVTHNIGLIRKRAGRPVRMIVPVKANAYGHGAVAVACHLEHMGVDAVATANIDEAIELRTAGVQLPILMYASHLPEATSRLLAHGLTPTISDSAGLDAAAGAAGGEPVAVHLEVDSGFG
ncbi:MAG TPA: alanine racemase, partial [Ilumatobacteraceae bacterium]